MSAFETTTVPHIHRSNITLLTSLKSCNNHKTLNTVDLHRRVYACDRFTLFHLLCSCQNTCVMTNVPSLSEWLFLSFQRMCFFWRRTTQKACSSLESSPPQGKANSNIGTSSRLGMPGSERTCDHTWGCWGMRKWVQEVIQEHSAVMIFFYLEQFETWLRSLYKLNRRHVITFQNINVFIWSQFKHLL